MTHVRLQEKKVYSKLHLKHIFICCCFGAIFLLQFLLFQHERPRKVVLPPARTRPLQVGGRRHLDHRRGVGLESVSSFSFILG